MRSRIGIALAVVVAIGLVGFTGGAVAHPNAGASGNCDNSNSGGSGSVQVSNNPDLVDGPGEVTSVANGVALFAENASANPQGSDACDGEEDDDYIEAHASGGSPFPPGGVQVCYSDANDDTSPSEDNVNQGGHYDNEYCE